MGIDAARSTSHRPTRPPPAKIDGCMDPMMIHLKTDKDKVEENPGFDMILPDDPRTVEIRMRVTRR